MAIQVLNLITAKTLANSREGRVLVSAGGALLSVAILHILMIFIVFNIFVLPSDREFISSFSKTKIYLDKIYKMSNEDEEFAKIPALPKNEDDPVEFDYTGDLSNKRSTAYSQLFKQCNLENGITRTSNGDVYFIARIGLTGDYKGYARLVQKPQVLLPDLENHSILGFWYDHPDLAGAAAFREIGNGWYLCRGIQF